MTRTEDELRREIVEIGRWIHGLGFVAGYDGNISARLDPHRILSTPTTISKGMMQPDDLVVVDYEGKKVTGRRNVTSEIAMHLLVYKRRPDVNGVVHAHPPTATGYAAADLLRAYFNMETVEHFAKICLVTELLGRQVLLSETDVDKLLAARQRYFGSGTPALERSAACPVTDGAREAEHFKVSREELEAMV